jgi:hypothetical protein
VAVKTAAFAAHRITAIAICSTHITAVAVFLIAVRYKVVGIVVFLVVFATLSIHIFLIICNQRRRAVIIVCFFVFSLLFSRRSKLMLIYIIVIMTLSLSTEFSNSAVRRKFVVMIVIMCVIVTVTVTMIVVVVVLFFHVVVAFFVRLCVTLSLYGLNGRSAGCSCLSSSFGWHSLLL